MAFIRLSYVGFSLLVRRHLYIGSAPPGRVVMDQMPSSLRTDNNRPGLDWSVCGHAERYVYAAGHR